MSLELAMEVSAMDRIFRIENTWVLALLLVAALIGLQARWRGDPKWGGVAIAIDRLIRVGFALLVAAIVLFLAFVVVVGPIGDP